MNDRLTIRSVLATIATSTFVLVAPSYVWGQTTSDADYIAKVSSAAPEGVSRTATILAMATDGTMRTVRKGTNDFTCMSMPDGTPMCADKNGMEWLRAKMTNAPAPPDQIGFMYMLAGDAGASNTDPSAKGPTPDNHWVKTGPHVMILGPAGKALGYARTPDIDPSRPSVMWAGTPYEHVMIPVK